MTIDERLERLADRHEALSHTVELLTSQKIRALAILAEQNETRAEQNEVRAEQNEVRAERTRAATYCSFEAIRDSLQRLERIATAHERRIPDLETQAPG